MAYVVLAKWIARAGEQQAVAAAIEAHGASEHFKRHALKDAIPRLEARERSFYETW